MAYDSARWHAEDVPDGLPPESAGIHIGMFLEWCVRNDLVGERLRAEHGKHLAALLRGELSGRALLDRCCDDTLTDEDLNVEGNAFAHDYYDSELYLADYEELFVDSRTPTMFHVRDSSKSYERIARVVSRRFTEWREARAEWADGDASE